MLELKKEFAFYSYLKASPFLLSLNNLLLIAEIQKIIVFWNWQLKAAQVLLFPETKI